MQLVGVIGTPDCASGLVCSPVHPGTAARSAGGCILVSTAALDSANIGAGASRLCSSRSRTILDSNPFNCCVQTCARANGLKQLDSARSGICSFLQCAEAAPFVFLQRFVFCRGLLCFMLHP